MMRSYTIPGRMMGRNESERLAREHWSKANEVKRDETRLSETYARAAGIGPWQGPVDVVVIFAEKVELTKRGKPKKPRDADNIQGAEKAIVDGIVKAGIVPDDGPAHVRRVIPIVKYVEDDPHITVAISDYSPTLTITYPPVEIPGIKED